MKRLLVALLALALVSTVYAQEDPAPGGGDPQGGPPPADRRDGPGPMRRDGGPGMGRDRGPGGPGAPMPPPPIADRMRHVEMLRGYIDLVQHYTEMASNPTNAGVAAVITAGDILKARGNDAAIDYFNKLLPDVKDPSVQRAIRIQLADLYKAAGQSDKALDQLKELITGAPTTAPAPTK